MPRTYAYASYPENNPLRLLKCKICIPARKPCVAKQSPMVELLAQLEELSTEGSDHGYCLVSKCISGCYRQMSTPSPPWQVSSVATPRKTQKFDQAGVYTSTAKHRHDGAVQTKTLIGSYVSQPRQQEVRRFTLARSPKNRTPFFNSSNGESATPTWLGCERGQIPNFFQTTVDFSDPVIWATKADAFIEHYIWGHMYPLRRMS